MPNNDLLRLSAQIVTAYVKHNSVHADELPSLICTVYENLHQMGNPTPAAGKLTPAVPIKQSVFPSYVVCLEDGKRRKMLTRHLRVVYAMSPDQYRAKWNLPDSYPMVAPEYAARRSALAKENGLGRFPKRTVAKIQVQKITKSVRSKKPKQKTPTASNAEPPLRIST